MIEWQKCGFIFTLPNHFSIAMMFAVVLNSNHYPHFSSWNIELWISISQTIRCEWKLYLNHVYFILENIRRCFYHFMLSNSLSLFRCIFEDDSLLVINKQPGFVVHPTKGKPCHTIANGLMKKILDEGACYKIRFANRLDMNTSGLLIVAKNGFVQDQIIHQMKAGITEKKYLAV